MSTIEIIAVDRMRECQPRVAQCHWPIQMAPLIEPTFEGDLTAANIINYFGTRTMASNGDNGLTMDDSGAQFVLHCFLLCGGLPLPSPLLYIDLICTGNYYFKTGRIKCYC